MLAGAQYIIAGAAFCGAVLFAWEVYTFSFSRCIKFSCIFNLVPGPVIQKHMDKNPVMKKAWAEERTCAGRAMKTKRVFLHIYDLYELNETMLCRDFLLCLLGALS